MQILKKSHCYPKNPIVSNHVHLKNSFLQNEKLSLCDYWPTGETPFEWRFAGGPIVARFYVLTGKGAGIGLTKPASNFVALLARKI